MAGNPWNPRVRQIRGGRAAAILEPISKKFSRLNEQKKFSRLNEQKFKER